MQTQTSTQESPPTATAHRRLALFIPTLAIAFAALVWGLIRYGAVAWESLLDLPPFAILSLTFVTVAVTCTAAWFRLVRNRADRQIARIRRGKAPAFSSSAGNGTQVVETPIPRHPSMAAIIQAVEVKASFPPRATSGEPEFIDGKIGVSVPILQGQELMAANQARMKELPAMRDGLQQLRVMTKKAFKKEADIGQVTASADLKRGTTALTCLFHVWSALKGLVSQTIVLHLCHDLHNGKDEEDELLEQAPEAVPAAAAGAWEKKGDLVLCQPRPPGLTAAARLVAGARNSRSGVRPWRPSTRLDFIVGLLMHNAHGLNNIVAVKGYKSEGEVDKQLRGVQDIITVVGAKGVGQGYGIELFRVPKELGPMIGSFTPVIEIYDESEVTSWIRDSWSKPTVTMEGFDVGFQEADANGFARRVVLVAVGNPAILSELPAHVISVLGLDEAAFRYSCAPVAGMMGVQMCLFAEASQDEIETAYPGITTHAMWPVLMQRMATANDDPRARANHSIGQARAAEVLA